MLTELRSAVLMLSLMTLLTGVAYPLAMTGFAQTVFPGQARGSLIERDGKVIGSVLIAQPFGSDRYFHPRPSAAGSNGYDAAASSGSNLGPTSKALLDAVTSRVETERKANPGKPVPLELVTASGSGLDPDISPAAAEYQVARIAAARGLSEADVRHLMESGIKGRDLGILGEPRINVLLLNLALDQLGQRPLSAGSH